MSDTVIEQKTNELARYLRGSMHELDFSEPSPVLERADDEAFRQRILSLTSEEAMKLGIGRSTLHYLRRRARSEHSFAVYGKVKEKLAHSS